MTFTWWLVALIYLVVLLTHFGAGATLGFFLAYARLRRTEGADDGQRRPRSTALGFSALGALAGGVPNFAAVSLVTTV